MESSLPDLYAEKAREVSSAWARWHLQQATIEKQNAVIAELEPLYPVPVRAVCTQGRD
jgi:hypothetical protein